MVKKFTSLVFALLLAAGMTLPVSAQISPDALSFAGVNTHFTHWSLDYEDGAEETISQFAIPLTGFVPLARDMEARFYLGNSINSLETGNSDLSASGLGDFRMQVSRSFFDDVLLLSGGLSLPTGKTELDFDGSQIINRLSSNFLVFPVRQLGEGLDISLQAAVARQFEAVEIGGSISFDISGEYDPYETVAAYNPGDAVNLAGGITLFSDRNSAGFTLLYSSFGDDQLDGNDIFKQADYVLLSFDFLYQNRTRDIRVKPYFGYVSRGDNMVVSDTGAQSVESELKVYGDEFTALVRLESDVSESVTAGPVIMYRWIGESDRIDGEDKFGTSTLIGVGGNIYAALGPSVGLTLAGTFYTGDADDGAIDLTGLQTTVGLSATF